MTSLHIKLFARALPVLWVTRGQSADNWNALKIPTVQWEDLVFKANVLMLAVWLVYAERMQFVRF